MVLVGSAVTLTCASIETSMPGKRGAAAEGYSKALQSFFSKIFQAVVRHVDWGIVKCLVIAGPGFAKEQFREYLLAEAVRQDLKCAASGLSPVAGDASHKIIPAHEMQRLLCSISNLSQLTDGASHVLNDHSCA